MPLTPDAKKLLAETIRGTKETPEKGLRGRLLQTIHDEAERQYRLAVPTATAGLDEAHRVRRERIEAWIDERARAGKPKNKTELKAARDRLLAEAEKEAAATALNRHVLLRQLEALALSKPAVLTGGWNSKAYREFREFAPGLTNDDSEGFATLLQLVFDELAVDLPGLFGDVGLTRLFPIPASMLRELVERLDDRELASAWSDDTTLGWVYQFWNDPDREALDAKINGGGKIESHEIASKTQMFTERYMVEWLLQNSLGLMWLSMCEKHGWTADAQRVLPTLEARRVDWRRRRDAGEVLLDALMPIDGELEDHWKYYVPQPIPADAVEKAPQSVRSLKILDPACGSGHFLVIAFGLLAALYREEARHRGEVIGEREIAESILENNLFGIDIDPRAIQIAAAALYLKAKSLAKEVRPRTINLVAPVLQLGNLTADDPAVVHLREDLKREAGIPEELTDRILSSLAGVDHLGSLLKVDAAVDEAIRSVEVEFERAGGQGDLWKGYRPQQIKLSVGAAKATILERIERFLARHSKSEDLGLRLDGEQLAAGVRFVRIAREGAYDVVGGNPPYQGTSKMADSGYVAKSYPRGKTNLYAAFLERGPELVREGGISALLTLRSWMFDGQFTELRGHLLRDYDLRAIGDFDRGAFDEVPNEVLAVSAPVIRRAGHAGVFSVATQPTPLAEKSYDRQRTNRKRAAVLAQVGRYEFNPRGFDVIEGAPIVYWWSEEFLREYAKSLKLGAQSPARQGLATADNARFLRCVWELAPHAVGAVRSQQEETPSDSFSWFPFIKGAGGRVWFEPLSDVIAWSRRGLELSVFERGVIRNPDYFFRSGVAYSTIGSDFSGRAHRFKSIFDAMGQSVFPERIDQIVCLLNSSVSRFVLASLNPSVHFQVGDVNRLPVLAVESSEAIHATLDGTFTEHEFAREPSVEFRRPGPSAWTYAQSWAQRAVDRAPGEPLPPYAAAYHPPASASHVSFALGAALGRFDIHGTGIVDAPPPDALPVGILFLSAASERDSLHHTACAPLRSAWAEHAAHVAPGDDLRTYLRKSFFDFHKKLYESRPIYFPLSSAKKSFVAFISIHRWRDDTLSVFLADHLMPEKRRLEGELEDLRSARTTAANKTKTERRFAEAQKLLEELTDFITKVAEIAEKGPPPPDDKTPRRETDARYTMDLDDGVMVNSAALWPLLEPQWKDPKKWWKELATASGRKDYDWSHLAARYFPKRVAEKCEKDPSLAVAHKCFWALHPAKAYAWELRLQDEIRPEFTIDEPGSDEARAKFLADHAKTAAEIRATETKRRERKAAKAEDETEAGPLFDRDSEESEDQPDA